MSPEIITLTDAAGLQPPDAAALMGHKAANLARLAGAGFPVPSGFVVTAGAEPDLDRLRDRLLRAAAELTDTPGQRFAVRSSGVAEDLTDASFAGLYETVLDVPLEDLPKAVRQVFDSAAAPRVAAYQRTRAKVTGGTTPTMAVLVQVMVAPDSAGVAFTANPLTGDRSEAIVTAVRGLGERLVSGEADGEQWVVRGAAAHTARSAGASEAAITAVQALDVVALARRVEAQFRDGAPQDIEWAIAGGRLYLLQARPMTAVPEPVTWVPPHEGWWIRNFRLGEWLPEPVTPLFADWLLPAVERGVATGIQTEWGLAMQPESAVVNGWYYSTPPPRLEGSPPLQLLRHPGVLARVPSTVLLLLHPERMPGRLAAMTRHWRAELLPRYRRLVDGAEVRAGLAGPGELIEIVDRVAGLAGEYSWSVATLAGSQWKIEAALARFCRKHLPDFDESPMLLVSALPGAEPDLPGHAVHSIDWYWPTAGELDSRPPGAEVASRHRDLAARRKAAEAACHDALASHPRLARRFARLLSTAQTYAVVREQQTRDFSLGWPLLRRCVLRLAEVLREQGAVAQAEDVFFLRRSEVDALLAGQQDASLAESIAKRRTQWERERRLSAPLMLGDALAAGRRFYARAIDASRMGSAPSDGALVGDPASPGRASGPVRVILDPADFSSFRPGEVLVARATAPAWTPLFADAAAVVTDGGSLAAHASLVAREYGIPAVVATGDATRRLHTGQTVTVDGGAGTVEVAPAP